MRFFSNPVPDWASRMSRSEFREFVRVVRAELAEVHPQAAWDGQTQVVSFPLDDVGDLRADINMARLAQLLEGAELYLWPSITSDFIGATAHLPDRSGMPVNWAEAEQVVLGKIYPRETAETWDPAYFCLKPTTPDLTAALVCDLGAVYSVVRQDDVKGWGVDLDSVWAQALVNIRALPLTDDTVALDGGGMVRLLHHEHRLATSHVLDLERHFEHGAPNGALVAVPHEQVFLLHELVDASAPAAANYMTSAAPQLFAGVQATGLSPLTYWWRNGQFDAITRRVDDHLEHVMAPEFMALLEALSGSAGANV